MPRIPFLSKRAARLPKGTMVTAIEARQIEQITGRNQIEISDQLGPGAPSLPTPLDASGRPRRDFFRPGWNLPNQPGENRIDYGTLRQVADTYPLLRKCLEIRKNELARLPWAIKPRFGTPMEKRAQLKANEEKIRDVQRFFDHPEGKGTQRTWQDWMRAMLEDHFVLDAACIFKRRTYGGKIAGLDLVDGGTIKVLIDQQGHIPSPPQPAYQQVIAGLPRIDFTLNELVYAVQNVRNTTPYGFSIVEANLSHFNLAMRWEAWTTAVFTDGSIPQALLAAPENWSREQIEDLMEFRRMIRQGDPKSQRDMEMLPYGVQSIMSNGADGYLDFSSELVNYLIDMTGAFLDVTRQELGLDPSNGNGLGGSGRADAQENVQYRRSLLPLSKWLSDDIFTPLLPDFGLKDFYWDWPSLTDIDPAAHATMLDQQVKAGLISLDDARLSMGSEPLGLDSFIILGSDVLFAQDLKKMQKDGAKTFDLEQQKELAEQQADVQNQQATKQSELSKGEAAHGAGLQKDLAEHGHGLQKDLAEHGAGLEQDKLQATSDLKTQEMGAQNEHEMAMANHQSGLKQQEAEHGSGLKQNEAEQSHQHTLAQGEAQHAQAGDLAEQQAGHQAEQTQAQHGLALEAAEHGSGLKQGEAEHGSGLKQNEAEHGAGLQEEAAHNDYGRQYDLATYNAQIAGQSAEQDHALGQTAAEADHGRNLETVNTQHANALMQGTHQADMTGQLNQSRFANELQMNDAKHSQAKELSGITHGNTLQAATHEASLTEQGKVNDFQRDSVRAAQSGEIARTNAEHGAKLQVKYPKPQPKKTVRKGADLDFLLDADTPTFEQAALAHGAIGQFPAPLRQILGEAGYQVTVSGTEAEIEGYEVSAFMDPVEKMVWLYKSAQSDDIAQVLQDALVQSSVATSTPKHEFGSSQFDIPAPMAARIKNLSSSIAVEDLADDGCEENPHLTVQYGLPALSSAQSSTLAHTMAGISPVEIHLGKTSLFETPNYDVVILPVTGSGPLQVRNAIRARVPGITDTHPTYHPHITLAYVKAGMGKKYAGNAELAGQTVRLDHLTLSDPNEEVRYLPLKETGEATPRAA
jgi:2'-5' RNA ligase